MNVRFWRSVIGMLHVLAQCGLELMPCEGAVKGGDKRKHLALDRELRCGEAPCVGKREREREREKRKYN